jgi:hypothetical protein
MTFAAIALSLTGCTHPLAIKNINMYHNTSLATLQQPVTLGVKPVSSEFEGKKLVKMVSDSLSKYNVRATTTTYDTSHLDAIATISVNSEYNGSGWNFLINWPGFLIWTPAWHGYIYEINHTVNVHLSDAKSGVKINSFTVPISLDVRHAAINRTWTEIGWLEWGIIPLIGGFVFINYDDNVTPIAFDKAGPILSDYIAQEIAENLQLLSMQKRRNSAATQQASSP